MKNKNRCEHRVWLADNCYKCEDAEAKGQHTQTPWMLTVDETEDKNKLFIDAPIASTGYDETVCIAQISDLELDTKEAKANGEFIVRAVNSHELLLETVKKTLRWCQEDDYTGLVDELRKVIAQVEEKL